MATIFPDHDTEAASHWLVRLQDPARPGWTQRRREFRTLRLHLHVNGYSAIGLQRRPILAEQITRSEPRYSSKDHHISHITARPWLISVTESIVLPPRPWAVKMSNIDKFGIREWLVPSILLPVFLVMLVAAAMLIQW